MSRLPAQILQGRKAINCHIPKEICDTLCKTLVHYLLLAKYGEYDMAHVVQYWWYDEDDGGGGDGEDDGDGDGDGDGDEENYCDVDEERDGKEGFWVAGRRGGRGRRQLSLSKQAALPGRTHFAGNFHFHHHHHHHHSAEGEYDDFHGNTYFKYDGGETRRRVTNPAYQ